MDLNSVVVNHATLPPRIVLYGDHGIGKTTFAASAPAPIVLRTEDGLAGIRVPTFPRVAKGFGDVINAMSSLYSQEHAYQTFILDTLDWLEPLIWSHTAMLSGKDNIGDFGYGKGFKYADEHWRTFLEGANALRSKGMTVILLAHAQIKKFDAPDTEAYDRYQIKLHERAANLVQEWADVVGFAHYEVHTVTQDAGFNQKSTKGIGVGRRILSVEERPAYDAKNRYSLPPDLDFPKTGAWQIFANACAPAYAAPQEENNEGDLHSPDGSQASTAGETEAAPATVGAGA